MSNYKIFRETIVRLAGEGNFSIYKKSTPKQRAYLGLKLLLNSVAFWLGGQNKEVSAVNIFYVKGQNQCRLHKHANLAFREAKEESMTLIQPDWSWWQRKDNFSRWFKMEGKYVSAQLYLIASYVLLGEKKYLNLYFLSYQTAIEEGIRKFGTKIEFFLCYNDQTYEASSIILALKRLTSAKTVVFQHGLILSPSFYFPVNADEFWAWGELSKRSYFARCKKSRFIVKGRYLEDRIIRRECVADLIEPGQPRILIAPSHVLQEIIDLVASTLKSVEGLRVPYKVAIKLHPATKLKIFIIMYCGVRNISVEPIRSEMEDVVGRFDAIATRNSTSAVEFLLRGKAVFVDIFDSSRIFPSLEYAAPLSMLGNYIKALKRIEGEFQKLPRLTFLKNAIDV